MEFSNDRPFRLHRMLTSLVLLGAGGVAGYYLYNDFNRSAGRGVGAPVAHVRSLVPDVRRKLSASFVWTGLNDGDPLYKRDSIQVGEAGAAVVIFPDKTQLEVGPESLVVIEDSTTVGLNYLRGSFIVRNKGGNDELIKVQQRGGKKEVQRIPLRLLSPKLQQRFYTRPGIPKAVSFRWQDSGKKPRSALRLELSRQSRFSKQSLIAMNATQTGTELKLEPGNYYWRVSEGGAAITEVREFVVREIEPPKSTWPIKQKVSQWKPGTPLEFRWAVPDSEAVGQGSHSVEIATDPQFKTIIKTQPVVSSSGQANIPGLNPGKYYWRMKSEYGDMKVSGKAESFEVFKTEMVSVDLVSPKYAKVFDRPKAIRFSWQTNALLEDVQYSLTVREAKTNAPVFQEKSRMGASTWKTPQQGLFEWEVQMWSGSQKAGQSKVAKFFVFQGEPIQLAVPKNQSEMFFWEKQPTFEFSWKPDTLAKKGSIRYRVEIASDKEFQKSLGSVMTDEPSLSSSDMTLKPGDYFWRVSLVNSGGDLLKTSAARQFYYGHYPQLSPPSGASPSEASEVNILTKPVALRWKAVENAQAYQVVLYKGSKKFLTKLIRDPQLKLKGIEAGKYLWTVRAIDRIKRPGHALPLRELTLTYGDRLKAPEIVIE